MNTRRNDPSTEEIRQGRLALSAMEYDVREMHLGEKVLNDLPRSRNTDPETSHLAEKHMRESGKITQQQQDVLWYVKEHPGMTAREYQDSPGIRITAPEGMFHRRLVELLRRGLVRRGEVRTCRVGRRKAHTWFPT